MRTHRLLLAAGLACLISQAQAQSAPATSAPAGTTAANAPVVAAGSNAAVTSRCSNPAAAVGTVKPGHSCTPRLPPHVDQVPDVASLKTPEAPAFLALGIAPTEIQRPTTPTGLKASLANGLAAGGTLPLLQNFAIEFSPFWLFPHRRLSYEQVLNEPWAASYRNLSFSFATSPQELEKKLADGSSQKTNYGRFGAGARLTLWPGTPTQAAQQCYQYLRDKLQASVDARIDAVVEFKDKWTETHPRPVVELPPKPEPDQFATEDEYETAIEAAEQRVIEARDANPAFTQWALDKANAVEEFQKSYIREHAEEDPRFQRCLSDLHAREGFMAEAAGAYAFGVPKGDIKDFKSTALQTSTIWLTAGFVAEDLFKRKVEGSLLAVFRYQHGRGAINDPDQMTNAFDAGLRVVAAFSRFGISVEGTQRVRKVHSPHAKDTDEKPYRLALSLDYRLTGGTWLSGTFGKDFGSKDTTPLLALANLQWNFDVERSINPDAKVTQ